MSGSHGKTSVGMGLGLTKAILDPSSFERFDAFEKIMKNRDFYHFFGFFFTSTQPLAPSDTTYCTPRFNPPQPQTKPTSTPDSTHCTPGPNPLHPLIQTTASLDSTHSTPRLKPQQPQTQHLCNLVTQPLLQPLNQPAACPDATCYSPVCQPLVSTA